VLGSILGYFSSTLLVALLLAETTEWPLKQFLNQKERRI
jgi:hypothetical protein